MAAAALKKTAVATKTRSLARSISGVTKEALRLSTGETAVFHCRLADETTWRTAVVKTWWLAKPLREAVVAPFLSSCPGVCGSSSSSRSNDALRQAKACEVAINGCVVDAKQIARTFLTGVVVHVVISYAGMGAPVEADEVDEDERSDAVSTLERGGATLLGRTSLYEERSVGSFTSRVSDVSSSEGGEGSPKSPPTFLPAIRRRSSRSRISTSGAVSGASRAEFRVAFGGTTYGTELKRAQLHKPLRAALIEPLVASINESRQPKAKGRKSGAQDAPWDVELVDASSLLAEIDGEIVDEALPAGRFVKPGGGPTELVLHDRREPHYDRRPPSDASDVLGGDGYDGSRRAVAGYGGLHTGNGGHRQAPALDEDAQLQLALAASLRDANGGAPKVAEGGNGIGVVESTIAPPDLLNVNEAPHFIDLHV